MSNKKAPVKSKRDFSKVIGIAELFVIVSIAYSSFVIISGLGTIVALVMITPQILWAAYKLVTKFAK